MKINNPNDISVNRKTLNGLLKDTVSWLNEHKDTRTRCHLLELLIVEIARQINISPVYLYGVLECSKLSINLEVNLQGARELREIYRSMGK